MEGSMTHSSSFLPQLSTAKGGLWRGMVEFSSRMKPVGALPPAVVFPDVEAMFPEITLWGSPYQRGKQYGSRVPDLIAHSVATYARVFACRLGLDWAACQVEALRYRSVIEDNAADIFEEMRGIADGSSRQLGEILALNCRTELMAGKSGDQALHPGWQEALFANAAAGVPSHPDDGGEMLVGGGSSAGTDSALGQSETEFGECTTVAAQASATASGATILAQTWDWQGEQRAACVILRIYSSDEPEVMTLTEAGMVAKLGLNSEGVAVGLNMMRSEADGLKVGMPVHVLLRKMLQGRTFEEARALPDAHASAASSCIVLASDKEELVALEITSAGVYQVDADDGRLVHSNHALSVDAQAHERSIGPQNSSRERHRRASELMLAGSSEGKRLCLDDFKAILRDHHGEPRCICRHPDMSLAAVHRSETVCGVIIDLGIRGMHIAPSHPCSCEFQTVQIEPPVRSHTSTTAVIAESCFVCIPS